LQSSRSVVEGPGFARQRKQDTALFVPAFVFDMTILSLKLQKPVGKTGCQVNLASLKLIIALGSTQVKCISV